MGKLSFLKQKKFYIHLLIIIVLCFIILWLTIKMLGVYTRHGKVMLTPDFSGLTTEEVVQQYGKDYHFILIDSIYSKTQEPGSIVQQDPLPGSKVKRGRNVYYIIVAKTPEKTTMPNLNNLSLRQALVLLESSGLLVKELIYQEHFARNAICEQRYNGQVIKPGTELYKGSAITLYVGYGPDRKNTKLPSLYGTPVESVQRTLNMAGLNLGNEVYEDHDSIQYMKVSRMDPPYNAGSVRPGTFVNVWYKSSRNFNFDKEKENALHEDSLLYAAEHPVVVDTTVKTPTDTIVKEENEENYEDDF
ncbi:MAG: PASTA domain-containing protein [Bacteroidales bacterium]|nr:PASTA domain-containing protein [Bacteroidales bacterium]